MRKSNTRYKELLDDLQAIMPYSRRQCQLIVMPKLNEMTFSM